jgi:hypothetical protein
MPHDIDYSLKPRYVSHPGKHSKTGAHLCIGNKIEMQPGFRNFLKPDRDMPRQRGLGHGNDYLISRTGVGTGQNGVRIEKCKLSGRQATDSPRRCQDPEFRGRVLPEPRHDGAIETLECRCVGRPNSRGIKA